MHFPLLLLAPLAAPAAPPAPAAQEAPAFRLHFDADAFAAPFTGDVFVAFAEQGEPRRSMHSWFGAPPLVRFHVSGISPGSSVTLRMEAAAAHDPADWSSVVGRSWRMQAVARVNRTSRTAGRGEGDVYGEVVVAEYEGESPVELNLDTLVEEPPFRETDRTRLFTFESPALSAFHGFPYTMKAGVHLPREYGPDRKYPVVYSVTGFGGTHESIYRWSRRIQEGSPLDDCILVVPDASNLYGHSVFCDSSSIGPWGEALVHELIPELEREFGGAGPEHRYVTGVSSGGWSSLWLQVAYPTEFAGCWSHVPDPIDFHDFQQIDLYDPLPDGSPRNMYGDEEGTPRPLARRGDEVMVTYEDFVRREHVTNPGGQIRSFEATFSPLGADGTPRRVFDVETGAIDHEAARAWRAYDISHILLTRWDELRGALAGKIHVYAGEVDTFYLEGAVERFQALAREKGLLDEMVVEVVPGMSHALHREGDEDMVRTIAERAQALRAPADGAD